MILAAEGVQMQRFCPAKKSWDRARLQREKRIVAPFRWKSVRRRSCQFTEEEKAAEAREEKKKNQEESARKSRGEQTNGKKGKRRRNEEVMRINLD